MLMLHGLCLQRICDDVPAFTDASTKLIMSAVRQLLNCIVFAGMQPRVDNDTVSCCCQAISHSALLLAAASRVCFLLLPTNNCRSCHNLKIR